MNFDMSQFRQTFLEESFEGLDTMEAGLLALEESSSDVELVNTIFRAAHSIKGGSGTFGFSEVTAFTHVVETLLDELRSSVREYTPRLGNLLLESVDVLRHLLTALRDEVEIDQEERNRVQVELERLLESAPGAPSADDAASPEASRGWMIRFRPHAHLLRTGNDPVLMFRGLAELGRLESRPCLDDLPDLADLDSESCFLSWELFLEGEATREQILELFEWVEDDCDLEVEALEAAAATPEAPGAPGATVPGASPGREEAAARKPATASREASSIRVGTEKVDSLVNMVGELVITQSMLGQLSGDFDMSKLERLRDGLAQLERNTRELQESVMRIRMMPISFAFNRIPRMVHDLCNKLGKKVDLEISGEGTELDKTVLEKIVDPLVHLIRNAVDHGVEIPEVRREAGKSETGTVWLDACHRGGNIVIEIRDDGAGIDTARVLEKAREKGLVGPHDQPDTELIHDLIFHAGFSTAQEVSDVSGRGVGMDVVRKNIKALGGQVEVSSREGEGTRFSIRLPLTLAILDGQLIRVGESTYILPLISIIESLQIKTRFLKSLAGKALVYKLRDDYIPIIRLHEVFGIEPDTHELENGLLVVVEGDGQKAGLVVDDLLSQQQVVIKSLESNYKKVEGFSGATILGDGTVALILDISGLIQCSRGVPSGLESGGVGRSETRELQPA